MDPERLKVYELADGTGRNALDIQRQAYQEAWSIVRLSGGDVGDLSTKLWEVLGGIMEPLSSADRMRILDAAYEELDQEVDRDGYRSEALLGSEEEYRSARRERDMRRRSNYRMTIVTTKGKDNPFQIPGYEEAFQDSLAHPQKS